MHRRFPNVAILVVPVKVQGDEAPHEIAMAVATVNQHNLADVIIVGRGGGSLEDLWAFNTETVARSIAASAIPVVSAVGHEIDVTIADCVADLRAPTPSAAAELVMREKRELVQLLVQHELRLKEGWGKQHERIRSRIEHACSRLRHPARRIADLQLRLDDLQGRMATAVPRLIIHRRFAISSACRIIAAQSPAGRIAAHRLRLSFFEQRLAAGMAAVRQRKSSALQTLVAQLSAFNPAAILARGYSITRLLPSLGIVRSSVDLAPGAAVRLTLGKGVVDCIVEKIVK